ncbi:MAG: hypothetical protein RI885_769 [Actinomycetota bacterium]
MTRRVVLAGASGFIGTHLARAFREQGAQVAWIGRAGPDARWGDIPGITGLLDGADLVVNLAGKNVNCRYGAANRAEILRSRVETTRQLAAAIRACPSPPRLWVNSSTATIYRHAHDRPQTESTGEIGDGFSVDVATEWERTFFDGELPGTRRVALRMAIVLGDGSALRPLTALARIGLGGPHLDGRWISTSARRAAGTFHGFGIGGGRQKFSWVHLDDVLGVIDFLSDHDGLEGVVNVSSPHPTDDRTMMRTVRRVVGVPFGLPAFRWMIELGAAVLRSESELLLKSRWVMPERLLAEGYEFRQPHLEGALRDILTPR